MLKVSVHVLTRCWPFSWLLVPLNVTQLKLYLGPLSYYGKFLPNFVFSASPTVQAAGKMFGGNGHLSWSKPSKRLKYCSHLHNYLFISIHSFFSCLVMHLPMALVPCLPTKCLMALHSLLGMFMHTLNFAEHSYS